MGNGKEEVPDLTEEEILERRLRELEEQLRQQEELNRRMANRINDLEDNGKQLALGYDYADELLDKINANSKQIKRLSYINRNNINNPSFETMPESITVSYKLSDEHIQLAEEQLEITPKIEEIKEDTQSLDKNIEENQEKIEEAKEEIKELVDKINSDLNDFKSRSFSTRIIEFVFQHGGKIIKVTAVVAGASLLFGSPFAIILKSLTVLSGLITVAPEVVNSVSSQIVSAPIQPLVPEPSVAPLFELITSIIEEILYREVQYAGSRNPFFK